jgi:hypothetical protein
MILLSARVYISVKRAVAPSDRVMFSEVQKLDADRLPYLLQFRRLDIDPNKSLEALT